MVLLVGKKQGGDFAPIEFRGTMICENPARAPVRTFGEGEVAKREVQVVQEACGGEGLEDAIEEASVAEVVESGMLRDVVCIGRGRCDGHLG